MIWNNLRVNRKVSFHFELQTITQSDVLYIEKSQSLSTTFLIR